MRYFARLELNFESRWSPVPCIQARVRSKMECKINLRGGNQDAWRRWLVNRNDVITAHGLDAKAVNRLDS